VATEISASRSHFHLTNSQAAEYFIANTAEELRQPSPKVKGVLRLKRKIAVRGLSRQVGAPLAMALAESSSRDWALAMLRNYKTSPRNGKLCSVPVGTLPVSAFPGLWP